MSRKHADDEDSSDFEADEAESDLGDNDFSNADLSTMKIAKLQMLCGQQGLSKSGTKAMLIERLGGTVPPSAQNNVPANTALADSLKALDLQNMSTIELRDVCRLHGIAAYGPKLVLLGRLRDASRVVSNDELTPKAIGLLRTNKLIDLCRSRGLAITGTKCELIERLGGIPGPKVKTKRSVYLLAGFTKEVLEATEPELVETKFDTYYKNMLKLASNGVSAKDALTDFLKCVQASCHQLHAVHVLCNAVTENEAPPDAIEIFERCYRVLIALENAYVDITNISFRGQSVEDPETRLKVTVGGRIYGSRSAAVITVWNALILAAGSNREANDDILNRLIKDADDYGIPVDLGREDDTFQTAEDDDEDSDSGEDPRSRLAKRTRAAHQRLRALNRQMDWILLPSQFLAHQQTMSRLLSGK